MALSTSDRSIQHVLSRTDAEAKFGKRDVENFLDMLREHAVEINTGGGAEVEAKAEPDAETKAASIQDERSDTSSPILDLTQGGAPSGSSDVSSLAFSE